MKISFAKSMLATKNPDLRVIVVAKNALTSKDKKARGDLQRRLKPILGVDAQKLLKARGFTADHLQSVNFSPLRVQATTQILLVGLVLPKDASTREHLDRLRNLGATIVAESERLRVKKIEIDLHDILRGH